ncbi:ABC transporter permease [Xanthobacter dioxanivorans]|uniref:ABC transporter permease n=1 Tax=Xanthobacter dioxanivorans TaxID=2528964 RepID=A0A974SIP7_9HYPH|nr:ABC transporter permease [Xanthobacter dioxanivorans]QRG05573.1 ABC transporter permease [Xanthobacter dioxanivorans]
MTDASSVSTKLAVSRRAAAPPRSSYWREVGKRLLRDRLTMACLAVLLLMALVIVLAPLIAPYNPLQGSMARRLKPVGYPGHILGTDELGRDMLTRLIYGGRLSWFVGLTPVVIAFVVGGALGITAGYAGGRVNMLIMRTTDVFYAFPSVLLAVAISGALGPGIGNAIVAMTMVFIPMMIRISETVTTSTRNLDYVEAARATGANPLTVVRVHVLPNVLGPIFVYATALVSVSMILASGLSFIGLGVKPPEPEWGLMLNTLRTAIYSQPLLATLPGICIFVTSICFNMASDGLRTAMDVKN